MRYNVIHLIAELDDPKLTPTHVAILVMIEKFIGTNKDGTGSTMCYISQKKLSKAAKISTRNLIVNLKKLSTMGYITITKPRKGAYIKTNFIEFNMDRLRGFECPSISSEDISFPYNEEDHS